LIDDNNLNKKTISTCIKGETVDNIYQNVQRAAGDIEKGRDELRSAEQNQRSARKKKLICGSILIVVLLIVLLVILSEFGAFSR
jgi:t-SNARE complex subunit (syntaxin)